MLQQTTRSTSLSKDSQDRILRRIAWVIALGVLLNPLNSSMIAVALLKIGTDFQIGLSTVTWMVSGFYLAGAVGPSLAGKLADLFGAKRLFIFGLFLVLFSSLLAPLAPNFSVLLALRIIQALGSSVAFPAGMSILRSVSAQYNVQEGDGKIASSLGLISIMANVMAAL